MYFYSSAQIEEKSNFRFQNAMYDILILKVDSLVTRNITIIDNLELSSEKEIYDSLSNLGLFFALNAGIVDSSCNLLGLCINKGNITQDINTNSGSGNFYLMPNGFIGFEGQNVVIRSSSEYDKANSFKTAVQSGPMLVIDSVINTKFDKNSKNKHRRLGVGTYQEKGEQFLVFATSLTEVSFFEFATLFIEKYNCKNALNIESGTVCTFHLPSSMNIYSPTKTTCKYLYLKL